MKIITIIPARMNSSRFPGKPLALINGVPMIEHVISAASQSVISNANWVATCDTEIYNFVRSIGGNSVMTSTRHTRASDRCAEAVDIIEKNNGIKYDIVAMVQGDEPLITSSMIDLAVSTMAEDYKTNVVNLLGPITGEKEYLSRNTIKVVCDTTGNALYFSRSLIPNIATNPGNMTTGKQVCVIVFRRQFLETYCRLSPTPLENFESIDMLRVLEYGYKVRMVPIEERTHPVDVASDIDIVENILHNRQLGS